MGDVNRSRRVRPRGIARSPLAWSASQSKALPSGHGKVGFMHLSLTVRPEVKDALIERALKNGTNVMVEARKALDAYLEKKK